MWVFFLIKYIYVQGRFNEEAVFIKMFVCQEIEYLNKTRQEFKKQTPDVYKLCSLHWILYTLYSVQIILKIKIISLGNMYNWNWSSVSSCYFGSA